MRRPDPSPLAGHWTLDPDVTFLNHGAFGACPREVLALQTELRARMERDPIDFLVRAIEPLLDEARTGLGAFLHADPDDLAFVDNATAGVNTVLRSLVLQPGDELLTTDHAYNACANALRGVAGRAGARVVVAQVPFPLRGPEDVSGPLLAAVTDRTRLVLLDHVTSATGVVFPVEALVPTLQARGADVLVDGAHAPGMVAGRRRGARRGVLHRQLPQVALRAEGFCLPPCAPGPPGRHPSAGHQPRRQRATDRPLALSPRVRLDRHPRPFRPALRGARHRGRGRVSCPAAGTRCVPGITHWPAARGRCCARRIGVAPPCPESMLGSLAAVELPADEDRPPLGPLALDPLQEWLFERRRIEVPVYGWPLPRRRWIRVSPHLHNSEAQYVALASALREAPGLNGRVG